MSLKRDSHITQGSGLEEQSTTLKDFLAEQDRIVDFGNTLVYRRFIAGEDIEKTDSQRDLTKNPGPIGVEELNFLIDMLKSKKKEDNNDNFLL